MLITPSDKALKQLILIVSKLVCEHLGVQFRLVKLKLKLEWSQFTKSKTKGTSSDLNYNICETGALMKVKDPHLHHYAALLA